MARLLGCGRVWTVQSLFWSATPNEALCQMRLVSDSRIAA
nr:hypothetical protein JVH1_4255 [Rhodococcus sp. JVH1]